MARGGMDISPLREPVGISSGNFFLHVHMFHVHGKHFSSTFKSPPNIIVISINI